MEVPAHLLCEALLSREAAIRLSQRENAVCMALSMRDMDPCEDSVLSALLEYAADPFAVPVRDVSALSATVSICAEFCSPSIEISRAGDEVRFVFRSEDRRALRRARRSLRKARRVTLAETPRRGAHGNLHKLRSQLKKWYSSQLSCFIGMCEAMFPDTVDSMLCSKVGTLMRIPRGDAERKMLVASLLSARGDPGVSERVLGAYLLAKRMLPHGVLSLQSG